jgi:L-lactate dehydrogenase complex protein LldG
MTARSAREEILGDIKRALHREGKADASRGAAVPALSSRLHQIASEIEKTCEGRRVELTQQLESEVLRIGGRFHRAATGKAAIEYIDQVASARQARRFVAWEAPIIEDIGLREKLEEKGIAFLTETADTGFIATAAAAEVGVSGVDYALADTGTLVLLAKRGQARSISLLPPVHIALVRPEQVLPGLSELFPLLRATAHAEGRDLSSAITFITGPSRTADIELTLVVGVHGPQELHVLLLD